MNRRSLFLCALLGVALVHAKGVETDVNGVGSFNTSAPTSADIANWDTGWGESGITGWDYIGADGPASGVYLGNDWVLTAAHVGAGDFTLDGTTYDVVPGSTHGFINTSGTVDLTLFQVAQGPDLPAITLETATPTRLSSHHDGDQVAMIGYGGGTLAWGVNTVTCVNVPVQVAVYSSTFNSIDYETAYGTVTDGTYSATNNAVLIPGDSGGGDFIYDSSTGTWMLAGINEAVDGNNDSYMVQVSTYASQINTITGATSVPEPGSFALAGVALAELLGLRRKCKARSR